MIGPIKCCLGFDGNRFLHKIPGYCDEISTGCPILRVVGMEVERNGDMGGYTNPEETSSPPNYYLRKQTVIDFGRYLDGPARYFLYECTPSGDSQYSCDVTYVSPKCAGKDVGGTWHSKARRTKGGNNTVTLIGCYNTGDAQELTAEEVVTYTCGGENSIIDTTYEPITPSIDITSDGSCDGECRFEGGVGYPGYSHSTIVATWNGSTGWSGTGTKTTDRSCWGFGVSNDLITGEVFLSSDYTEWVGEAPIIPNPATNSFTGQSWETGTFYELDSLVTDEAALANGVETTLYSWETPGPFYSHGLLREETYVRESVCTYALLATDLMPGKEYKIQHRVHRSIAYWDEGLKEVRFTTPAQEVDGVHSNFVADDVFHILYGQLNVSREQFIEKKFSTIPADYGLSGEQQVITPTYVHTTPEGFRDKINLSSFLSDVEIAPAVAQRGQEQM